MTIFEALTHLILNNESPIMFFVCLFIIQIALKDAFLICKNVRFVYKRKYLKIQRKILTQICFGHNFLSSCLIFIISLIDYYIWGLPTQYRCPACPVIGWTCLVGFVCIKGKVSITGLIIVSRLSRDRVDIFCRVCLQLRQRNWPELTWSCINTFFHNNNRFENN